MAAAEAAETSPGKPAGWPKASISTMKQLEAGPPVDYSFKGLKSVTDLVYQAPVSGSPSKQPLASEEHSLTYLERLVHDGDSQAEASPSGQGSRGPILNTKSLRICNNQLLSLQGLDRVLYHALDRPLEMEWLDASCNQLPCIEDVVVKFPNLKVLYLHGNQISSLMDVLKLQALPRLEKLTLHGNPISEMKNYKVWVCAHLPKLKNLDFSAITKVERDKVDTWMKANRKKFES